MQYINITGIWKTQKKWKIPAAVLKILVAIIIFAPFISEQMYMAHEDFFVKRSLFVGGSFLFMIFSSVMEIKLHPKLDRLCSVFLAVISPFTAWIFSEILINEAECAFPPTPITQKEPLWIMISLLTILLIYLVIMAVTNSMRVAAFFIHALMIGLSIAICIVYDFRGIPMMAPDILTAKTATSVMGNYTIVLTFKQYAAIVFTGLILYLFLSLREIKLAKKIWVRGIWTVVFCICSAFFIHTTVFSDYMQNRGINIRMFRPMESYQKYGMAVTFVRSAGYARVKKPDGYSIEKVKEITKKYEKTSQKTAANGKNNPNIITVLNESFSDIHVLGDFQTNEDYMPFFHSLKKNCVKGYTYASIVGGQTANTEFELLTGNTLGFLSAGTTAFQLYIHDTMPSLVSNLKIDGYSGNKAMHPFNPYNYNRPAVYKYFGITDFIDKFDFAKGTKRVREYISDEAMVDKIIDEYEKNQAKTDAPFFMYNLTIQNHSPYDKDSSNFKQPIRIEDRKFDAEANRYVNLIKYSDDSLKKLVEYFSKQKEPTLIIFLGDHQPRLTDSFMSKITNGKYQTWNSEEMMKRYQVPFVIWANYDIGEKYIEKTSMNYLQSILTETAGVKMSGYQRFLNDIRKEVPVITSQGYWGKNGKFYQLEDKNSPYYDIIQEYRIIQYNMMFDTRKREDDFFYVKD